MGGVGVGGVGRRSGERVQMSGKSHELCQAKDQNSGRSRDQKGIIINPFF